MNTFEQLKTQYIEGIYHSNALLIKEEPFTLQSGKKSHIYLNHRNFLTNTRYLSLIAQLYHTLALNIANHYVLGAVDSIMSPIIVGAMSALFKLDFVIIQKKAMSHGTQASFFGELKQEILLIDDMTSTGETLIQAAQQVREKGGIVKHAIISAYRENNAIESLCQHAIEPLSIANFGEILEQLFPVLSPQEQAIVTNNPLIID